MCFCVGGGSYLSQKERDEIRAEVDAEFEAEERDLKHTKEKKKKKRKNLEMKSREAEDDFGSLFGAGITGKLPRFANKITLKVQSEEKYHLHFLSRGGKEN